MPSLDYAGDYNCSLALQLEKEGPNDNSYPQEMFSLEISAFFLQVPQHVIDQNLLNDEGEEDESWIYEADYEEIERTFLVERRCLLDEPEEVSWSTVVGFLNSMHMRVRVDDYVVRKILNDMREIASQRCNLDHKVLHVRVSIYVPPNVSDDDDNDMEPTETKSWVEGLGRFKVEDSGIKQQCAICLEEFAVGSGVAVLPCLHLYHDGCIVKWLEKGDDCPLCRSKIGSV